MKAWVRFWRRLQSDERRNRGVFWTAAAFSFVLGVLFTYLYGNLSVLMRNRETDAPGIYRLYNVSYGTFVNESYENQREIPEEGIGRLLESDAIESVVLGGLLPNRKRKR